VGAHFCEKQVRYCPTTTLMSSSSRVKLESIQGGAPDVEAVASLEQTLGGLDGAQVRACPIRNREDRVLPGTTRNQVRLPLFLKLTEVPILL